MATYSHRALNVGLDTSWRKEILSLLQKRNRSQGQSFLELIALHNRLFESADNIKAENLQLTVQTEKLRQENLELQIRSDVTSNGRPSEKTQALEQKLYRLQEELTELHRRKGENAQQLIDFRNIIQDKDKELATKDLRIKDTEAILKAAVDNQKILDQTMKELELTNQMLKDEHQALQIAYSSLEKKYRELNMEHNQLVERWLSLKAHDADRLNDENDMVIRVARFNSPMGDLTRKSSRLRTLFTPKSKRQRQAKLQKELADAAEEKTSINFPDKFYPEMNACIKVSLPNGVHHKFDAHEGEVNSVKWSPSGRLLATGGADRKVKLWEILKGGAELRGTFTGSSAAIMSVDFDAEETLVLGASNDFASRVWTLSDQRLRHTLTGHSGKVMAAKFLGDSNKVVSGSHDRTLKIWDLRSHACIRTIFAMSSCFDLVTDRPGTNIISGHFDKRIRFWDARSETAANEVLLQGKVTSLDVSSDGLFLLSCTRDDTLKVLDLRMNQVTGTYSTDGFRVGCDSSRAIFSPDGQYVAAGSQDGNIFIWSTLECKLERSLKEHSTVVPDCSWQPGNSGSLLVSCDRNRKVVVWSDF